MKVLRLEKTRAGERSFCCDVVTRCCNVLHACCDVITIGPSSGC